MHFRTPTGSIGRTGTTTLPCEQESDSPAVRAADKQRNGMGSFGDSPASITCQPSIVSKEVDHPGR